MQSNPFFSSWKRPWFQVNCREQRCMHQSANRSTKHLSPLARRCRHYRWWAHVRSSSRAGNTLPIWRTEIWRHIWRHVWRHIWRERHVGRRERHITRWRACCASWAQSSYKWERRDVAWLEARREALRRRWKSWRQRGHTTSERHRWHPWRWWPSRKRAGSTRGSHTRRHRSWSDARGHMVHGVVGTLSFCRVAVCDAVYD